MFTPCVARSPSVYRLLDVIVAVSMDDASPLKAVRHDGSPCGVTRLTLDATRLERPQLVLFGEPSHVRAVMLHEVVEGGRLHGCYFLRLTRASPDAMACRSVEVCPF